MIRRRWDYLVLRSSQVDPVLNPPWLVAARVAVDDAIVLHDDPKVRKLLLKGLDLVVLRAGALSAHPELVMMKRSWLI